MRILVVSQYFWPENFIINDIVRNLIQQGHDVVVATGKPNYPDGQVFPGYRAWGVQRDSYLDQVEVVRVPLWPRQKGGAINLIMNYLSFVISGVLFLPWLLRKRNFDAIFVFAPSPLTQVIPAIFLKWIKRANLVLWVQDLWPESLSATGFVKKPIILHCVGWMVKAIYNSCDRILVQSRSFVSSISRYTDTQKVIYFPNSVDINHSAALAEVPTDLLEILKTHFCVVFTGNLGTAQSLETVLKMTQCLQDDPEIRVVLVGSGSRSDWLQAQKQEWGLDNLILPGRFPIGAMPEIFEHSSALLVSLADEQIFAQTIPSKVQAYLAAGRPIIASLNGEGANVIVESGGGVSSPAGQVVPLVENVRRLKAMSALERLEMGRAGRVYFETHFEMTGQVKKLLELLAAKRTL